MLFRHTIDKASKYHRNAFFQHTIEIASKYHRKFIELHRICIEILMFFRHTIEYHRNASKCIFFFTYHRNNIKILSKIRCCSMIFRYFVDGMSKKHWNTFEQHWIFYTLKKHRIALKFRWLIGQSSENFTNQPKFLISKFLNAFLISEKLLNTK